MRIISLLITNFKNIETIELSNIPNFLIIVGENGVGKTSIFDAISFLKSVIGPYSRQDTDWWNQRILQQNPLKNGKNTMKIEIEIEPTTEEEKKLTKDENAKAGFELIVKPDGTITRNTVNENNASTLLSSWRKRDGIGAIEYIPANRTFREGQVQLQSNPQNEEQLISQRTSQLQNKYHTAKQSLVNFAVHDSLKPHESKVFPEVKELIEKLLGKEIKIDFDSNLIPKIMIKAETGFVDIDTLSSGQREIFLTYVGIHSTRLSNSVILFDEPDLHLHASLQKEVLKFLKKMSDEGNQIFLTTHALEMISESSEENIFHMSSFTSGSQLTPLKAEEDKLEIFAQLGASKYTFVNFRKVVFLEGDSDKKIIHSACPSELGLRFEITEGKSKLSPQILNEASQVESFFMINDRDFLSDSEISNNESKYNNKIRYLKRRHIENYILDSDELYEIYQKLGTGTYTTKADFLKHLLDISKKQFEQTVTDCFLTKHPGNTYPPKITIKSDQLSENALNDAFATTETRLKDHITNISNRVSTIRSELESDWDNKWLEYASGKNILTEIGKEDFSPNKSMEEIRELVSAKWDEKQLPQEILDILKDISKK